MSFFPLMLERLEREATLRLDQLAARPRLAAAALLALALFAYLPGVFLLPPVDRTEIVYAQSSRGMLERGDAIDATATRASASPSAPSASTGCRPAPASCSAAGRGTTSPPIACPR